MLAARSTHVAAFGMAGLLGAVTPYAAAGSAQRIHWRTGAVKVTPQPQSEIVGVIQAIAAKPDVSHLVIQFNTAVNAAKRAELDSAGLHLLSYLGDHAFFAAVSPGGLDADALARSESLAAAMPIERSWKLHPMLAAGQVPAWAVVSSTKRGDTGRVVMIGAYVLFHRDVPLETEGVNVARHYGALVRSHLASVNGLVIELPFANVRGLADEDAVQWIEPPLPRMSEVNNSNRARTGAGIVQDPPYNLDGSGVTVLVYDGGYARGSHLDFGGRLATRDESYLSDHATHVSCTVGGDGSASAGTYRGMAPGVTIESYGFEYDESGIFLYSNPGDIESDYDEAINTYGADIANNSIGTNTCWNAFPCEITGDYGVTSALIDAIVGGSLGAPFRVVWANGNERTCSGCPDEHHDGYHSTAPPACAKNHISVGALNSNDDSQTSFTSWGPADDGRLKPDLAAPGCQSDDDGAVTSCSAWSDVAYAGACGTSMSAPTLTGLSALLLQDYRAQFPMLPDPANATVKALFAHNAQDLYPPGPDYRAGYGSVRIRETIDFMRAGLFLEADIAQGDVYAVPVRIEPGDLLLKVTLAWDDTPGTPNVTFALVNDLDLRVHDPDGIQYFPWVLDPNDPAAPAAQTHSDHVNNIEQVVLDSPAAGLWLVEVFGFDVPEGRQPFSLCVTPRLSFDCNDNAIPDQAEIEDNPTLDCAGNGALDECEPDCDADGTADSCEIFSASSTDCNLNGTPDDCEPDEDCNGNGIQDICDIAGGTSGDCNHNTSPDECDVTQATSEDCNTNGLPDECEPDEDCNENRIQDICDIAGSTSGDCNQNTVPDECDMFDCGPPTDLCPGEGDCCVPAGTGTPGCDCARCCSAVCEIDSYCCIWEWDWVCAWEALWVPDCDCGGPGQDWSRDCNTDDIPDECDIAEGTSEDCNANDVPDECDPDRDCNSNDLQDICDVAEGTSQDCNENEVPDECESAEDCNANGVQDICDLAFGTSTDCNDNSVLDECDVAQGTSDDCNANVVPDECEPQVDCNDNGIQDICDVAAGTSPDCNDNDVPDGCDIYECGPPVGLCPGEGDCCDLEGNGTPGCDCSACCAVVCDYDSWCCTEEWDSLCALLAFYVDNCDCGGYWQEWSDDCNANQVPDECDVAEGTSADCNGNEVPDECDPDEDCNANGVQDVCDVAAGTSEDCNEDEVPDECQEDCNENSVPDNCDLAEGTSEDCDGNGIPDECDPYQDCNSNGIQDICDVAAKTSADCNANEVPDECEPDCNGNGVADECDLLPQDRTSSDLCGSASRACRGIIYTGTTEAKTIDGAASCGASQYSPDVWYRYTSSTPGTLTVSLCGSSYDTVLSIHTACPGHIGNEVACNDDDCDLQSQVSTYVAAGQELWIRVAGFLGDAGGFQMSLQGPGGPWDCDAVSGDCNENLVPDECDITAGTSRDCNGNNVPDGCEPNLDCNTNGVQDICDVAAGTSEDCNSDEVPDECQEDCNENAVPDGCDIAEGTSWDCDENGVPDECDPYEDCNDNGEQDICDVAAGTSADCNANRVPDECDPDCNDNGVADECDVAGSNPAPINQCVAANRACSEMTYAGTTSGMTNDGWASCGLSEDSPDAWYRFTSDVGGRFTVSLCGSSFDTALSIHRDCADDASNQLTCNDDYCGLQSQTSAYAFPGNTYWIRIAGHSGEVGDFVMSLWGAGDPADCEAVSADCNENVVPDECEPYEDCNDNGVKDICDIYTCGQPAGPCPGTGDCCDLAGNGTPGCDCARCCRAVCEIHPDCCSGEHGWQPTCAFAASYFPECDCGGITQQWSHDCNGNNVPDECEPEEDCNSNGVQDMCDLAAGTSQDCNANEVPDECELDTDGDGVIDECDGCPEDAGKVDPGQCGCGNPDSDTDGDDIADCIDPDDDNDGVSDADDGDPIDPDVCQDTDGDRCDDCAMGTDDLGPLPDNDPANDGPDGDGDGICDADIIPTISGWGSVIMVLLLSVAGRIYFGRRRRVALRPGATQETRML